MVGLWVSLFRAWVRLLRGGEAKNLIEKNAAILL